MGDHYPPDHGPVDDAQSRLDESVQVLSPRDTQFAGFAERLFQELQADLATLFVALGSRKEQDIRTTEGIIQMIIAQRAYDFALHVMMHLEDLEPRRMIWTDDEKRGFLEEMLKEDVPDMIKWEEE